MTPNAPSPVGNGRMQTLKERTSIDTLAERLGLMTTSSESEKDTRKARRQRTSIQAQNRQNPQIGSLEEYNEKPSGPSRPAGQTRPHKKLQPVRLFCCIGVRDAAPRPARPIRPAQRYDAPRPGSSKTPAQQQMPSSQPTYLPSQPRPQSQPHPASRRPPGHHLNPITLEEDTPVTSETQALLSLIPATLPPPTVSALLVELSKTPSEGDDPGYIYIFWLTPEIMSKPEESARELLTVPDGDVGGRKASVVMRSYSKNAGAGGRRRSGGGADSGSGDGGERILLKIGRANNVQRRLQEWKRQCGYNISLIRYYPYVPSSSQQGSPAPSPLTTPSKSRHASLPRDNLTSPAQPRKVRHANKVERLIHLELTQLRPETEKCQSCGRMHKEWFEVEAHRKGVKAVDEVVRRWVDWSLREHGLA